MLNRLPAIELSDTELKEWAKCVGGKYPEVESIWLCGSRTVGVKGPDHDYDILVVPEGQVYRRVRWREFEQSVAFDEEAVFPGLEMYFYRIRGDSFIGLGRWDFKPGESPPEDWFDSKWNGYFYSCFINGCPPGDFSRFLKELEYAKLLYERAMPKQLELPI